MFSTYSLTRSGDMQFLCHSTVKLRIASALTRTSRFQQLVLSVLIVLFYLDLLMMDLV